MSTNMIPPPNTLHASTLTFLLLLLTSSTSSSSTSSSTKIQTHPADIQSLKSFKSALNPQQPVPGSCLASWDFSYDPCASASSDHFTCGITCTTNLSSSFARVTDLSLDPAGYSGSLSTLSSLNLPFLQTLSLSDNFISGPLPASFFSNLNRLQKLILSRNSFSGSLPQSLSALIQLQELCLDNNDFQGPIYTNLTQLQRLKRLELQRNRFTGKCPELGSLKDLYFLDAGDNQLAGKIEQSMLPESLIELSLRNNSLESFEFSNLPYLQVLDLSHNALSGSVSGDFFTQTSLQQLTLSHNNLTSIEYFNFEFNRSSLVSLDLSHNMLQGPLPQFIARLPALSSLSLEHNMLTGQIPSNYAKRAAAAVDDAHETTTTSSFWRLLLGGNYLFGLIPGPLTSLKPGRVNVSLVDNCLYSCPHSFFFCQGGNQKSVTDCNRFRHFDKNKNN